MQRFTDEQLVAYADGELPAEEARRVAAAAASDPALAARIALFADSRRLLQDAFAEKLAEPPPERLLRLLAEPAAARAPAGPRAHRQRRWAMALAASIALAIGIGAGYRLQADRAGDLRIAGLPGDPQVVAQALETRASGEVLSTDGRIEVMPLSTLRTAAGGYCREFKSTGDGAVSARGVACRRDDGTWRTEVLVAGAAILTVPPPPGGGYAPAAGDGPDLAAGLGPTHRLTSAEESRLMESGWRE